MQFSTVAIAAFAATAAAWSNDTVVYTTEVFTAYTTYCPASTEITLGGKTYTATASQTLTITECPCTVTKPVSSAPSVPTTSVPASVPVYVNSTVAATTAPVAPASKTKPAVGTTSAAGGATSTPSTISSSGANKAFALSGASLAGVLGLAAYFL